jgi:sulfotransferase
VRGAGHRNTGPIETLNQRRSETIGFLRGQTRTAVSRETGAGRTDVLSERSASQVKVSRDVFKIEIIDSGRVRWVHQARIILRIHLLMDHGIHFISGLPRSGSTLLSAILRQNPRIHAGMSSPVAHLIGQLQVGMSAKNEFHMFINDTIRKKVLLNLFKAYYEDIGREKIVFDTGRPWCGRIHVLHELFPEARIICCVRSLPDIVDSIERIIRSNPLEPSRMFNFEAGGNIYNRVETLMSLTGMIGNPLNGLRDAFYGDYADKLLLVPYNTLVTQPGDTLAQIYGFIGQAPFEHDFEDVEYEADEFDMQMGSPGLHKVSGRVEARGRSSVLPPDIRAQLGDRAFWLDPLKNPHNVPVLMPAAQLRSVSN